MRVGLVMLASLTFINAEIKNMLGYLCPKLILGLKKGRVFAVRSNGPLQESLVSQGMARSEHSSHGSDMSDGPSPKGGVHVGMFWHKLVHCAMLKTIE